MSNIDWSKAPDGAEYWRDGLTKWFKVESGVLCYWNPIYKKWEKSHYSLQTHPDKLLKRPDFQPFTSIEDAQPERKPYTCEEALRFQVDRLDSWPTDISSAPTCHGWGWSNESRQPEFEELEPENSEFQSWIGIDSWMVARPDFVPFVSVYGAQPAPDMVNHPPHYQSDNGIECIDAIRAALGRDGFIAYCIGNSMKYQWREKADKLEDMRKAAWYLNRAIEEQSK